MIIAEGLQHAQSPELDTNIQQQQQQHSLKAVDPPPTSNTTQDFLNHYAKL